MAITEKNKKYYAEERRLLRRAMLNKKLVVFVGSGASLDSGMPKGIISKILLQTWQQ